jgi:hypothetical protein
MFSYLKKVLDAVFPSPRDTMDAEKRPLVSASAPLGRKKPSCQYFEKAWNFHLVGGSPQSSGDLESMGGGLMYAVPSLKVMFFATTKLIHHHTAAESSEHKGVQRNPIVDQISKDKKLGVSVPHSWNQR